MRFTTHTSGFRLRFRSHAVVGRVARKDYGHIKPTALLIYQQFQTAHMATVDHAGHRLNFVMLNGQATRGTFPGHGQIPNVLEVGVVQVKAALKSTCNLRKAQSCNVQFTEGSKVTHFGSLEFRVQQVGRQGSGRTRHKTQQCDEELPQLLIARGWQQPA